MNVQLKIDDIEMNIDDNKLQKMIFVFNALENGWSIKKKNKKYYFSKKHKGNKEVFLKDYLELFIKDHSNVNNIFL
jgi:hypothetical protein